jgi:hypothetical protein
MRFPSSEEPRELDNDSLSSTERRCKRRTGEKNNIDGIDDKAAEYYA